MSSFLSWVSKDHDLSERYVRAREAQADFYGEQIIDISDDTTGDYIETVDNEGNVIGRRVDPGRVQRAKLQADSRKWVIARMNPGKWGDRIANEISGPKGGAIAVDARSDPRQVGRRVAMLLAMAVHKQEQVEDENA